MSLRGETITMRSLSPCPDSSWSRFLTASEQFLPMLPPLTLLLVLLRLCSSSQLLPKGISLCPEQPLLFVVLHAVILAEV